MSRQTVRLLILVVVLGLSWLLGQQKNAPPVAAPAPPEVAAAARQSTWAHPETLPDHFARHGHDFHARDAADYAAQAAAFLQRAKATGLPAKRDHDGSLRIYDPATGTFGAYNANGTTRTFFKPGNPGYFDHQPGTPVDLRAAR